MLRWGLDLKFHVIRNLTNLVGKVWNGDLFFLNEDGEYHPSFNSNYHNNPLVADLLSDSSMSKGLFKDIKEKTSTSSDLQLLEWVETGLAVLVIPIFSEQKWIGAIGVTGFISKEENRERVLSLFKKNSTKQKELVLKHVEKSGILFLKEVLISLAEEMIIIHEEDRRKSQHLDNYYDSKFKYGNMIGKSSVMQDLYSFLDKIKNSESSVLIEGENGTGKELVAQSIYQYSPRHKRPFVAQNCASLNDNLLESELFGHVKGAFTGAIQDKKGLFELADKGTLFLDEIGDTSLSMQAKLLRVLQEGEFFPVGSVKPKKVDVRVIVATNKNLRLMIQQGTFREDLYYRLNIININVPPLRKRSEDIPLLVDYFLSQQGGNDQVKVFNESVLEKLMSYSWPGNIRELQNEVQRMSILSQFSISITTEHLSPKFFESSSPDGVGYSKEQNLKQAIKELEKKMIGKCLKEERWNKTRVAKKLGISRAALISKVKDYELEKKVIA